MMAAMEKRLRIGFNAKITQLGRKMDERFAGVGKETSVYHPGKTNREDEGGKTFPGQRGERLPQLPWPTSHGDQR